jgi:hypothetical protein
MWLSREPPEDRRAKSHTPTSQPTHSEDVLYVGGFELVGGDLTTSVGLDAGIFLE